MVPISYYSYILAPIRVKGNMTFVTNIILQLNKIGHLWSDYSEFGPQLGQKRSNYSRLQAKK